ncbi:DUF1636 family protein [Sulfitobacter aestuarii]|uniref:DUF1636 family protein n=1 Tax=Sulfitobacter aestuarii TaxID=2161676 RepID=A0ABW5U6B1_9RHOB
MKVFVCTSCSERSAALLDEVAEVLPEAEVSGIDCMSGCTRGQSVAFRSPGKVAYLFGGITEAELSELRNFATLYAASPDGTFADAPVLGGLRHKALARIPG